jgi:(3,5-dihydroxyphenyl)acetyl-CoA 1,2-dioxygenase
MSGIPASPPPVTGDFAADRLRHTVYWQASDRALDQLPRKAARNAEETRAATAIHHAAREVREQFLRAHVAALYAALTDDLTRFVRIEELVFAAADLVPGLAPSRARLEAEAGVLQRDKDGLEIDQGILLSHILGHERSGLHLCHAMLLPRAESQESLDRFVREGSLDLGAAKLSRRGRSVHLTISNPRYLNAEDAATIDAVEIAVDVATLDPESDIAVLRGGPLDHPKYGGKRAFGSGINLTHLYRGRIPFTWYLKHDLGFMHKFLRGVARPGILPDDVHGHGMEKPWIAAVESFAIGGHCQMLLTMDFVLAAADAYMTLPARKEGIIPGVSNMRLVRFVGDRIARQLIQYERRLLCDTPEGRLICDEIVPAAGMDRAIDRVVEALTNSGAVGAIGNRRAFRVAEEPLDLFRRYCAVYAREQAQCHFSPALIANLERYWDAQNRRG